MVNWSIVESSAPTLSQKYTEYRHPNLSLSLERMQQYMSGFCTQTLDTVYFDASAPTVTGLVFMLRIILLLGQCMLSPNSVSSLSFFTFLAHNRFSSRLFFSKDDDRVRFVRAALAEQAGVLHGQLVN